MEPPCGAEVVAMRAGEKEERLLALIAELASLVDAAGVDFAAWRVAGPRPYVVRVLREK